MSEKPNPYAHWERTRKLGRTRFVLIWGGVIAGVLEMCLIIVMLTSKDPGPSPMWVVVVCAPLALLNGAGWAMAMWAMMEHLYSAEQKKIQVAQKAEQEKIRVAQRLKFLEAEVEHLRKNLPPSKDTNITELP